MHHSQAPPCPSAVLQVPSAGSVLMSFNNNPATDSIPLLSPFIAPSLRSLGPLLSQLATSPLRSNVEMWVEMLKGECTLRLPQIWDKCSLVTPREALLASNCGDVGGDAEGGCRACCQTLEDILTTGDLGYWRCAWRCWKAEWCACCESWDPYSVV